MFFVFFIVYLTFLRFYFALSRSPVSLCCCSSPCIFIVLYDAYLKFKLCFIKKHDRVSVAAPVSGSLLPAFPGPAPISTLTPPTALRSLLTFFNASSDSKVNNHQAVAGNWEWHCDGGAGKVLEELAKETIDKRSS